MSQPDLASLTLFPGTPEQVLESRKRSFPQWGGTLTKEQYLEREVQMDQMEHAVDSGLITWVLAPRDNPRSLDFMCSCETYKRRGLVRYPGSDMKVKEVTCYAVACVFTAPENRGKGYASHMMRLLHWVCAGRTAEYNLPEFPAEWGAPPPEFQGAGNGLFSILYSDVGEDFYKHAGPGLENSGGWEARGPISTIWKVAQEDEGNADSDGWTWLKHGDLDAMWAKDVENIRRTLEKLPPSGSSYVVESPTAITAYLPDRGVGSFHIFRSMFGYKDAIKMDTWGVERNGGDADHPVYATWSIDPRPPPPTLIITRLSASEAEFPSLLAKIQEVARQSGITRVEAWNLPPHLLRAASKTGGETFQRHDHLPSIKWYGKGATADVEWAFNEKFCWC